MKKFLNDIRSAENPISGNRKIINTIAILFLGFVFKLYCRIFPKKLCDDLVWIYSCFSIIGFCLLVCKGEKQTGIYTISADFGSIV